MSITIFEDTKPQNDGFFLTMFGHGLIKNSAGKYEHTAIYAERLFYNACSQMIAGYSGESFSFMKIDASSAPAYEIESDAFFLMPSSNKDVVFTNHFGTVETLSKTAACIAAWLISIEQVATKLDDQYSDIQKRIYNHMNDLNTFCLEFTLDGKALFDEKDKSALYNLIR
jgi:hypothetical protein